MKKFLSILAILAAVMLAPSCQKELPDAIKNIDVNKGDKTPTPSPTPTPTPAQELKVSEPGQFGAKGGEQTVTVTATAAWKISKGAGSDWLTIKPESGSAGTAQVTLTAAENSAKDSRKATITIQSGELTKSMDVSQSAASPTLTLTIDNMEFAAGSGSKIFSIKSNTAWAVSSNGNWCSVSPTSGSGDGSVTVSVDENTSTSSRTATITVESATITQTLAVTQNGATPITPPASQDRTFTVGGVTFKMIAVEGGTFMMGATSEQGSDAYDNEKPAHQVTLSSYYIGETEVTQALWQAVMGSNPSYFSGSNKPVEEVSWIICMDFIKKLNSITGENFRLPTEAEWEFAARGGNKSWGYKYAGSNTLGNVAWYWDNIPSQSSGSVGYGTQNVASKQANELGLYDMSGNVWEWCQDYIGLESGAENGDSRVARGGSWYNRAVDCRVSCRGDSEPSSHNYLIGLRLAL